MSDSKNLPKRVPSKDLPFRVELTDEYGTEFAGDFVVRVPNGRSKSKLGLELAKINGGVPHEHLDQDTAYFHNAVAYLKVNLIEAPDWFTSSPEAEKPGMSFGLDAEDTDIVVKIWSQVVTEISKWREQVFGKEKAED